MITDETKLLPPDLKAKWIAALRSGKYTQAHETLRSGDSFCCLGVLCDVFDPKGWKGTMYTYLDSRSTASLPASMNREFVDMDEESKLIGMNDTKRASFAEIADWIEEHL